ncbi:MAG: insulinase family protein [Berryella intestinalis]|uniref:insulinase family protein n=1 Tax=Berryella intestinalis TaxID=1531429 RepID=UPI002A75B178|nr:insulinase family protein [Berryella intestinalis]MDY3129202.1 insulinase family protein [Berryella intestinalis]
MQLTIGSKLHGFTVEDAQDLSEINGTAFVMRHEESGARLLFLQNDDGNKSFSIGFRTPPKDDTGVFHILEHSVLCGSRKFPVKEPFVDLLKTSMQTFLNAMTFPDKTLYPVASTNERDLLNLMDVYLDAVFHPTIYSNRSVFEQEGWHYELRAKDGAAENAPLDARNSELVYNGVVFNEMKGALSNPSSVLFDELQLALFPDTAYAFESGGTPQAIPSLTYEGYLDEHRRHYRLDNSYTVLYGNLDIDRVLSFLDDAYFSPVSREEAEADRSRVDQGLSPLRPRELHRQAPVVREDILRAMDTAPENACVGAAFVIGDFSDPARILATDILLDALMGSNEAPVKRALLDAGVAAEIVAYTADSLLQPFAVVEARGIDGSTSERLVPELRSAVTRLVEQGFDRELVEASLSRSEFVMREHNFGMADGVAHAMTALCGWLYDDAMPTAYLRYEETFSQLRAGLETGYFEDLARSLFLDNDHWAKVEVVPETPDTDIEKSELARRNAQMGDEERTRIIEAEQALRTFQTADDSPEAKASLPRLTLDDIGSSPVEPPIELDWKTPITTLRHRIETNRIAYAYRYFDAGVLSFEDLPYLSVLAMVLGKLATDSHSAAEIDTLVQGKLGNLSFYARVFELPETQGDPELKLVASASALEENAHWLANLPREVMLESDFGDAAKIKDILMQRKIDMEQDFANSGHLYASERARSYYSKAGVLGEQLGNVDFYLFMKDLLDNFDQRADDLSKRLRALSEKLLNDNLCTVSFTGSDAAYDAFWKARPALGRTTQEETRLEIPEPSVRNEAFVVPSDVSYTALGWDSRLMGGAYHGAWSVASRALTFDYLWNEVRVKGGAYGVGFKTSRYGNMRFYSYRDPHIDETVERFCGASRWLDGFDPSPEAMEGFKVSTVAEMDTPIKARQLVLRQDIEFFSRCKPEDRARIRKQALETTAHDVRALAPYVEQMTRHRAVCTFGNRDAIEASGMGMTVVDLLGSSSR